MFCECALTLTTMLLSLRLAGSVSRKRRYTSTAEARSSGATNLGGKRQHRECPQVKGRRRVKGGGGGSGRRPHG